MATSTRCKAAALKGAMSEAQLLASLSESTVLSKKDVAAVLDELAFVIDRHIHKRAVGAVTLPGLLKITRVRKPASKARTMISPRTGEEIQVPAKRVHGGQGSAAGGPQANDGVAPRRLAETAAHPGAACRIALLSGILPRYEADCPGNRDRSLILSGFPRPGRGERPHVAGTDTIWILALPSRRSVSVARGGARAARREESPPSTTSGIGAFRCRSAADSHAEHLWTPPVDASVSSNGSTHAVRCLHLSGLLTRRANLAPLACMEMRGSGPYQHCELEGSLFGSWLSRPRLVDRLPLPVLRPARIPDSFPRFALSGGGGNPVGLLLHRQRPDDTRHPVGQHHRDQHPRLARQHPGQPGIVCPAAPGRPTLVVKRFEMLPGSDPPNIRLISANPVYEPYMCLADEDHIVGTVIWTI